MQVTLISLRCFVALTVFCTMPIARAQQQHDMSHVACGDVSFPKAAPPYHGGVSHRMLLPEETAEEPPPPPRHSSSDNLKRIVAVAVASGFSVVSAGLMLKVL